MRSFFNFHKCLLVITLFLGHVIAFGQTAESQRTNNIGYITPTTSNINNTTIALSSVDIAITDIGRNRSCINAANPTYTQTYRVTNTSTTTAATAVVATLATIGGPAGVYPSAYNYVSYTTTATISAYDSASNKWTIPSLPANTSYDIVITYQLKTPYPSATSIVGYSSDANVTSSTPDANTSNNTVVMQGVTKAVFPLETLALVDDAYTFDKGTTNGAAVLTNDRRNGNGISFGDPAAGALTIVSDTSHQLFTSSTIGTPDAQGHLFTVPNTLAVGVYTVVYKVSAYQSFRYYKADGTLASTYNNALCINEATATAIITIVEPKCYKAPASTTGGLNPFVAISTIANRNLTTDWQNNYKGADMVIESKIKGFTINRLSQTEMDAIPVANLLDGMAVYNATTNKLLIYVVNGTDKGWKEFNKQTCLN